MKNYIWQFLIIVIIINVLITYFILISNELYL